MIFLQIIKRELKIATRKQAEILNPLWFFLIVITLFPLVIGPDPKLLSRIAPGVAWVRHCFLRYCLLNVYFEMTLLMAL